MKQCIVLRDIRDVKNGTCEHYLRDIASFRFAYLKMSVLAVRWRIILGRDSEQVY